MSNNTWKDLDIMGFKQEENIINTNKEKHIKSYLFFETFAYWALAHGPIEAVQCPTILGGYPSSAHQSKFNGDLWVTNLCWCRRGKGMYWRGWRTPLQGALMHGGRIQISFRQYHDFPLLKLGCLVREVDAWGMVSAMQRTASSGDDVRRGKSGELTMDGASKGLGWQWMTTEGGGVG